MIVRVNASLKIIIIKPRIIILLKIRAIIPRTAKAINLTARSLKKLMILILLITTLIKEIKHKIMALSRQINQIKVIILNKITTLKLIHKTLLPKTPPGAVKSRHLNVLMMVSA